MLSLKETWKLPQAQEARHAPTRFAEAQEASGKVPKAEDVSGEENLQDGRNRQRHEKNREEGRKVTVPVPDAAQT